MHQYKFLRHINKIQGGEISIIDTDYIAIKSKVFARVPDA